jgi:Domain of unknown function (DUF4115)
MARPDCPRCGSDLVAVAVPDGPSEWVEELRGGSVHSHPVTLGEANWLCRVCGYRWQPPPDAEPADLEPGSQEERDLKHGHGHERGVTHGGPGGDLEPEDVEPERPADERDQPPMRQFAELLKLGPERSFVTAGAETSLKDLPDPRRRRSIVGALMASASLAVVVVLALQAPRSSPLSDLPEPTDEAATVGGPGPVTPSPSPEPDRRGVRAVLQVEQPCWVRVVADGEFVDEVTLQPGDSPVYRAKRDLELRLGNAGGVTLRVNGEPFPTGPPGDVITIMFSWRGGELHVERVTPS